MEEKALALNIGSSDASKRALGVLPMLEWRLPSPRFSIKIYVDFHCHAK